jgi:hypothetical protein
MNVPTEGRIKRLNYKSEGESQNERGLLLEIDLCSNHTTQ